jgi:hypothetical protein
MSCLDNTSVGNGHLTSSSAHADALFYFLYSISFIILLLVLNTVLVCLVMGCYVPHVAAVTQIGQFGCIRWLNH